MNAEALFNRAFNAARDPRSDAYRQGVRHSLAYHFTHAGIENPFTPGTAEADAFWSGVQEGNALYRGCAAARARRD